MVSGPVVGARRERWSEVGVGRPAGARTWVPGGAQWFWGQRERALVFAGSFGSALAVGVFGWGTPIGAVVVGIAFLIHVYSTADAIKQGSFPGFGRWVPTVSALAVLGLGCYGPVLGLAMVLAWPGPNLMASSDGVLVNRWAYGRNAPEPGDWIWVENPEGRGRGVAQVLAGPGFEVEWRDGRLLVGGRLTPWQPPRGRLLPDALAFTVPDGHVLVSETRGLEAEAACGMALLPEQQIAGRAWIKMYPIWERRLLL